ncbi:MAG: N-acetylmuramoyl-L-alanine amidase [Waddliaceae bacterium]
MSRILCCCFILIIATSCSSSHRFQERPPIVGNHIGGVSRETIVIDPGHGGKDCGAKSSAGHQYQEKSLNLTTALLLSHYLKRMGYQTILTRGDDIYIPLKLRTAFANGNHATLFVSIHYNSAPNLQAEGIEVFYYDSEKDQQRSAHSRRLATIALDQVIANTGAKSRGIKHGNLAVIRETKMPAILIEGGFVTNENEFEKLKDVSYLQTIAESLACGIHHYLHAQ